MVILWNFHCTSNIYTEMSFVMFLHETMNISIVNAIYVLMRSQLGHCLFKSIRKNQICVNEIDIINLYMPVVSLECFLLLLYGHRCTGCWLCIVYIGCVDVDTLSHFNWCSSVMNYVCPRYLSCLYVCFSPFYGVCLWDDNEAWPSTEKGDRGHIHFLIVLNITF